MVERYFPATHRDGGLCHKPNAMGEWVRHSDYAELEAERDNAIAMLETQAKLHRRAEEDKARLSEAADFLCDRLDEFDRDINDDADFTAYQGHVAPAKSRLRAALSGSGSGWRE